MEYNPSQLGSVLIFKPGVEIGDVKERLQQLADILEYVPRVNEFDPAWGSPVWYVP